MKKPEEKKRKKKKTVMKVGDMNQCNQQLKHQKNGYEKP